MSNDPRRFLRYLDAERNASLLYRALAESTDGDQREALLELADVEDKHAQHWEDKLTRQRTTVRWWRWMRDVCCFRSVTVTTPTMIFAVIT